MIFDSISSHSTAQKKYINKNFMRKKCEKWATWSYNLTYDKTHLTWYTTESKVDVEVFDGAQVKTWNIIKKFLLPSSSSSAIKVRKEIYESVQKAKSTKK